MSAPVEWLGSWGMQRPDVDADGYPIDDWDDDTTGQPDTHDTSITVSSTEPLGWWVISGVELLAALRRCAAGESPDLVYAEIYANSEHEQLRPSCDWCPEPATWVRRGVSFDSHGCADHPINKLGWERL